MPSSQAFNFSYWGYASAIATVMLAGVFLLSWLVRPPGLATATADVAPSSPVPAERSAGKYRRPAWLRLPDRPALHLAAALALLVRAVPASSGWCRCRCGPNDDIFGYELLFTPTLEHYARCGKAPFPRSFLNSVSSSRLSTGAVAAGRRARRLCR